jgi:hypothetical protein
MVDDTITETVARDELAAIGLDFVETGDITENDIRLEHGLNSRVAVGVPRCGCGKCK